MLNKGSISPVPLPRVVVFDLDDTLIHAGNWPPIAVPHAGIILEALARTPNTILAMATFNISAREILSALNWYNKFAVIAAWRDVDKTPHLAVIADRLGVPVDNLFLYDDVHNNVLTARQRGVRAHWVNPETGVQVKDLRALPPTQIAPKRLDTRMRGAKMYQAARPAVQRSRCSPVVQLQSHI